MVFEDLDTTNKYESSPMGLQDISRWKRKDVKTIARHWYGNEERANRGKLKRESRICGNALEWLEHVTEGCIEGLD